MFQFTSLPDVDAVTARRWLEEGKAVLVDVRSPAEYHHERIPGSVLVPLHEVNRRLPREDARVKVFFCLSGARTAMAGSMLRAAAGGEAYQLGGGLIAWKRAGFPTAAGG